MAVPEYPFSASASSCGAITGISKAYCQGVQSIRTDSLELGFKGAIGGVGMEVVGEYLSLLSVFLFVICVFFLLKMADKAKKKPGSHSSSRIPNIHTLK